MEDSKGYPRYQYSVMVGKFKEKQMVCRGDEWKDFAEDVDKLNEFADMESAKIKPEQSVGSQQYTQQNIQGSGISKPCPMPGHNGELMYERMGKNGRPYFSHKGPDGNWCYGKPPYIK